MIHVAAREGTADGGDGHPPDIAGGAGALAGEVEIGAVLGDGGADVPRLCDPQGIQIIIAAGSGRIKAAHLPVIEIGVLHAAGGKGVAAEDHLVFPSSSDHRCPGPVEVADGRGAVFGSKGSERT